MDSKGTIEIFFPITICLSLHPFVIVGITLYVHLPRSLFFFGELALLWKIEVVKAHVDELGFDEVAIKVFILYIFFIIIETSISCPNSM